MYSHLVLDRQRGIRLLAEAQFDSHIVSRSEPTALPWMCAECLNTWVASPLNRLANQSECPSCVGRIFDPAGEGWVYRIFFRDDNGVGIGFGKTNKPEKRLAKYRSKSTGVGEVLKWDCVRVGNGSDASKTERRFLDLLRWAEVPRCGESGASAMGVKREAFYSEQVTRCFLHDFHQLWNEVARAT